MRIPLPDVCMPMPQQRAVPAARGVWRCSGGILSVRSCTLQHCMKPGHCSDCIPACTVQPHSACAGCIRLRTGQAASACALQGTRA